MLGPFVKFSKGILTLTTESGPVINEVGVPEKSRELANNQYQSPSAGSTCASVVEVRCKDTGRRDKSRFNRPIYKAGDQEFVIKKFKGSARTFDRIEISHLI